MRAETETPVANAPGSPSMICILVLVLLCSGPVAAEPPEPGSTAWVWKKWWRPGMWGGWVCCDEYCPKPKPLVEPLKWCGTDDYCPKPQPPVPPSVKGCGDDYCPKPVPTVGPPVITSNYTCGPPEICNCPAKH